MTGWQWSNTKRRILKRDGHRCTEVVDGPDGARRCEAIDELEVHHEIPLELGGTNDDDNLRTRCRPHHLARHGKRA
jgi:5-methylcytosine-specific restriction endonuclease McrA